MMEKSINSISFICLGLGKLVPGFELLAINGWVLEFLVAIIVYYLLMMTDVKSLISDEELGVITSDLNKELAGIKLEVN